MVEESPFGSHSALRERKTKKVLCKKKSARNGKQKMVSIVKVKKEKNNWQLNEWMKNVGLKNTRRRDSKVMGRATASKSNLGEPHGEKEKRPLRSGINASFFFFFFQRQVSEVKEDLWRR